MHIKISDRILEGQSSVRELMKELNEYDVLVMCIKTLGTVESNPDKFKYDQSEYDKLESRVRDLCNKHEIKLPEYVEWSTIEFT